jgi:hypothetical protein
VRTGVGTDQRWLLGVALVAMMVVLVLLPSRFSLGPNWVVPTVEALLLTAAFFVDRSHSGARLAVVRGLSIALVAVLVAAAVFITIRLLLDLIEGGPETNSATALLRVGCGVWIYTMLAFAFLYWLLDGGGPEARIWNPPAFPDLAFPQHHDRPARLATRVPRLSLPGVYQRHRVQPTDVMPLARWGKLAMALQAVGSLAVLSLVIARAVNIFT